MNLYTLHVILIKSTKDIMYRETTLFFSNETYTEQLTMLPFCVQGMFERGESVEFGKRPAWKRDIILLVQVIQDINQATKLQLHLSYYAFLVFLPPMIREEPPVDPRFPLTFEERSFEVVIATRPTLLDSSWPILFCPLDPLTSFQ
jgi:hypothetical protein